MVDVYADADADTEDDADDEQVGDYVHGDIQSGIRIRVERGCGHAEDVAHGRGIDLWGLGFGSCVDFRRRRRIGVCFIVLGHCFAKSASAIVLLVSILK